MKKLEPINKANQIKAYNKNTKREEFRQSLKQGTKETPRETFLDVLKKKMNESEKERE